MTNILDVELNEDQGGDTPEDMLEIIFNFQKHLEEKYKEIERASLPCIAPDHVPVDIDSYSGQHQIKERLFNCMIEIAEAVDCMKNKSWKQSMVETDINHLKEEMADALHFYVAACILMGISAEELFNLYLRKNKVNQFRQRSQY